MNTIVRKIADAYALRARTFSYVAHVCIFISALLQSTHCPASDLETSQRDLYFNPSALTPQTSAQKSYPAPIIHKPSRRRRSLQLNQHIKKPAQSYSWPSQHFSSPAAGEDKQTEFLSIETDSKLDINKGTQGSEYLKAEEERKSKGISYLGLSLNFPYATK